MKPIQLISLHPFGRAIRSSLLLALLAAPLGTIPVDARPSSSDRHFESQMCPGPVPLETCGKGDPDQTMRFVWRLYKIAGPRLGNRLVEPCNLLCFGDLRPYASWNGFIRDPQPEDLDIVDRLNEYLVPRGYSLHPKTPNENGEVATFSVHSLAGLERTTAISKLSWVPKYHRSSGWPGYFAWKDQIHKNLANDPNEWHKVEGIMLGYPDSAVDHYNSLCFGWPLLVDVWFPGSLYFNCGQPVPQLPWPDSARSDIQDFENSWGGFLKAAYTEDNLKPFNNDPEFTSERQGRLDQRLASFHNDDCSNSAAAEREARAKVDRLASLAGLHRNLEKIALLAQLPPNGQFTLQDWLWRGSVPELDPDSRRFFQAYFKVHPTETQDLFLKHLRSHLETTSAEKVATAPEAEQQAWEIQLQSDLMGSAVQHLDEQSYTRLISIYQRLEHRPVVRHYLQLGQVGQGPLMPLRR